MQPSHVRKQVFADHAKLRQLLDTLSELTMTFEQGQRGELDRALELAQALQLELTEHFAFEDEQLSPVLRERDSWGPVRAGNLEQHHVVQREQLRILESERARAESPVTLARAFLVLIDELRVDMAFEERELLSQELLSDDFDACDGEDG